MDNGYLIFIDNQKQEVLPEPVFSWESDPDPVNHNGSDIIKNENITQNCTEIMFLNLVFVISIAKQNIAYVHTVTFHCSTRQKFEL